MNRQVFGVLFPDIPGPRRLGFNVAVLKCTKRIELHISSNKKGWCTFLARWPTYKARSFTARFAKLYPSLPISVCLRNPR